MAVLVRQPKSIDTVTMSPPFCIANAILEKGFVETSASSL
jgi:hypothetical protein